MIRYAALLAAAASLAAAARADDFQGAQTPSHNIYCLASPADDVTPTVELRCDIQHMDNKWPPAPKSCPLSWGDAFVLDPTGPGRLQCHGDTTENLSAPVMAYGTQWKPYAFVCTSQAAGLTCVNAEGHGFSLSRTAQKVF
ncbi:MAG TPA: DUF6636 domain-containing protein [Caulobacteraceae bacterium]|jgi:hypothetical protein